MRPFLRHRRLVVWIAIVAILAASSMRSLLVLGPLDIGGVPFGHDFCFTGPASDFNLPWEEQAPDKPNHCPFCRLDADSWDIPVLPLLWAVDVPAVISSTVVREDGQYRLIAAIPWQSRAPPFVS